jgi:hypothetical protein
MGREFPGFDGFAYYLFEMRMRLDELHLANVSLWGDEDLYDDL